MTSKLSPVNTCYPKSLSLPCNGLIALRGARLRVTLETWFAGARLSLLDLYSRPYHNEITPNEKRSCREYIKLFYVLVCFILTRRRIIKSRWINIFTLCTKGYGNITPMSTSGRIFCILYGFVGIPLFNVVAVSVGSLITGLVTFIPSYSP